VKARRTIRLFVYGSLMRGQQAHRLLSERRGARRVGRGWIGGTLLDLGDYPGVLPETGGTGRVHGELWEMELCPGAWRPLDAYEECDRQEPASSLFARRRVRVHLPDGAVRAWVYFLTWRPAMARVVPSGDWRAGRRER
jgi:gamma-glutamylcyclotransferase (GGCT)/AIG2-like uncharacterized protein YtfP